MSWMIFLLACASEEHVPAAAPAAPAAPAAAPAAKVITTKQGAYTFTLQPTPEPVPLSALFEVAVTVTDAKSGKPVEQGSVLVDATMPQHGHGMATKPEPDPGVCADNVCTHPGGVYVTRGMKFHMPGSWVLHVEVEGPSGRDSADVPYTL